jgi:hypothetical protein
MALGEMMRERSDARQRAEYIFNLLKELRTLALPIGDGVLERLLCLSALVAKKDAKRKGARHFK